MRRLDEDLHRPVAALTQGRGDEYLLDAIAPSFPTVISIVGAGGKTSALRRLGRELHERSQTAILTASTRLGIDQLQGHPIVRCDLPAQHGFPREILLAARAGVERSPVIFLISRTLQEKAIGLDIPAIDGLAGHFDVVAVEADGARGRSLKAPSREEPVWPFSTRIALAVIGIDALGQPLAEKMVHRPEQVTRLTGQPGGAVITHQTITTCLVHPEGIFRGVPKEARRMVLINKVNRASLADARMIARLVHSQEPAIGTMIGDVRPEAVRIWA